MEDVQSFEQILIALERCMHHRLARLFSICNLDAREFLASRRQCGQRQVARAGHGGGRGSRRRGRGGGGGCGGRRLAPSTLCPCPCPLCTATRLFVAHGYLCVCVCVCVRCRRRLEAAQRIVWLILQTKSASGQSSEARPSRADQGRVSMCSCSARGQRERGREEQQQHWTRTTRHSHQSHGTRHPSAHAKPDERIRSLRHPPDRLRTASAPSLISHLCLLHLRKQPRPRLLSAMLSLFASLFAIAHAQPAAAAPRDKHKPDKHVKYEFMGQSRQQNNGGRQSARQGSAHECTTQPFDCNSPSAAAWPLCLTAGPPGTICDLHCQRCWLSRLIETES